MALITTREISESFENATFARGEAYYRENRVADLSIEVIDEDFVILRSNVKGSGYVYSVEVSVETAGKYHTDIVGDCSCPVRYNCKHAVATCLAYQAFKPAASAGLNDSDPGIAASIWLDNLVIANQPEGDQVIRSPEFLAYLLDDIDQPGQLSVRLVECKLNKNGRPTKGRRLNTDLRYFYNFLATSTDKRIASLLGSVEHSYGGGSFSYKISGELGSICLREMVGTGRCFWLETANPPMTLGAARAADVSWLADDDGNYRLKVSTEPAAVPLDVSPPLFLDKAANCVGAIAEDSFNVNEWHLLLNAPAIPAEQVEKFSKDLILAFPDSRVPPPQAFELTKIENLVPTPCLTLQSDVVDNASQSKHVALLHFEYGEWTPPVFPALPTQILSQGGEMVSLVRDLLHEQSCIEELANCGLTSHLQDDGFLNWKPEMSSALASLEIWRRFLSEVVPLLVDEGWQVKFDDTFSLEFVEATDWQVEIASKNDWFELGFDLSVGEQRVKLLPLITQLLQEYDIEELPEVVSMQMQDGRYLQLPMDQLGPVCEILHELFENTGAAPILKPRFAYYDALRVAELDESLGNRIVWQGGENIRQIGARLKNFSGLERVDIPAGTNVDLREYQHQGVDWLQFLRTYGFNGILADDMGLGKTVQTLIHLQIEKSSGRLDRPCLIIAPTSLMSTWMNEAARFTPDLRVLKLQGLRRHAFFEKINDCDIVLSTYPLVVRDQGVLMRHQYHYVILDEAQIIKNPRAQVSQLVRLIDARHRLCLSGTPMENHLGELWALFDFLMPGYLSDKATFTRRFRTPIEQHADEGRHQQLSNRLAPFMLRRRKQDVIAELPPKTEMIRTVTFEPAQAALYESIRLSMEKRVQEAVAARGFARSHITILDALLKLRQTCCDPRLLKLEGARRVKDSAKLQLLMEMLAELLAEGRRILVFSQFTQMLGLIASELDALNIGYTKLTGQTRHRDRAIDSFRTGEVDLFLISLKAGGVGLNLTEADTVIHYDPWWNPATENQATDRTHRIGQDKPVFVYKLITENTLEEKIVAMQARKQILADGLYQNIDVSERFDVTLDDLRMLLSPQVS